MKTLKRSTTVLFLALLVANPVYADFKGCPKPTPDQSFQMELCAAHEGCAINVGLMGACASLTSRIKAYFANKKPELDPGEYKTDRDAPLGPSEIEQARKNNERYQRDKSLREYESSRAYNELVVLDRSIKARLERDCGNPLDQGCKEAVQAAESLAYKFNAYNSNPDFVALRGKLTAMSPGIAAPYGKQQEAAWEETKRKQEELEKNMRKTEELRKNIRETDEKIQKLKDAGKKRNEDTQETTALPRRGGSSGAEMFQDAIKQAEQEEKDRPAREARERLEKARAAEREQQERAQAEANARAYARQQAQKSAQDARELREGLGQLLDAYGQYQKAKQDSKRPAPSPGGSGESGGGCGGIGSTTCR